eukprot:SAG31_NODE_1605_length_7765_cov_2.124315_9_plen_135_part_00
MPEVIDLLGQGVDIDTQSWSGWTALHYAAAYGHYDMARLLLERGADDRARGLLRRPLRRVMVLTCLNLCWPAGASAEIAAVLTGQTPYMVACVSGQSAIVELLISAGCDQEVCFGPKHELAALSNRRTIFCVGT